MLYHKTSSGYRIALDLDHLITFCPDCGKEIEVSINEIYGNMADGDNLNDVRVWCATCSRKRIQSPTPRTVYQIINFTPANE